MVRRVEQALSKLNAYWFEADHPLLGVYGVDSGYVGSLADVRDRMFSGPGPELIKNPNFLNNAEGWTTAMPPTGPKDSGKSTFAVVTPAGLQLVGDGSWDWIYYAYTQFTYTRSGAPYTSGVFLLELGKNTKQSEKRYVDSIATPDFYGFLSSDGDINTASPTFTSYILSYASLRQIFAYIRATAIQLTTANKPLLTTVNGRKVLRHDTTDSLAVTLPSLRTRKNLLTNTRFTGAVTGTPGTPPTGWTNGQTVATLTALDDSRIAFSNTASGSTTRRTIYQTITTTGACKVLVSFTIEAVSGLNRQQLMALTVPTNATAGTYTIDGVVKGATTAMSPGVFCVDVTFSAAGSIRLNFGVGVNPAPAGFASVTISNVQAEVVATGSYTERTGYQAVSTSWSLDDFSDQASVYTATPDGVQEQHGLALGSSGYALPGKPGSGTQDVLGWVVAESRLPPSDEDCLRAYFKQKAGL